jgi:hypothetical protein
MIPAMGGINRRLLESSAPEKEFDMLQQEMIFLAHAYLKACCTRFYSSRLRRGRGPPLEVLPRS